MSASSSSTSLNIIFAGTPEFAATSLVALLDTPHVVKAVLTQPDKPAGRGKKLTASPVKVAAEAHGIPVLQPLHLKDDATVEQLKQFDADVMIVVAYGLLIPQNILSLPRFGCINIHGSLLPRWRGAAPIQRAIEAGDTHSGVGIMQMEIGLDTGPVLLEKSIPIAADETGGSLHDRLAALGASALLEALADLPALQSKARVQPKEGITYAHKLSKQEAEMPWQLSARALANKVRAFNPWPVAWSMLNEQPIKIWHAEASDGRGHPGDIISVDPHGIEVACGEGSLRLLTVQLPGKKAMAVSDLLRGRPDAFQVGSSFSFVANTHAG
ncbi:MAG: methionyl-tRNA formyltransferase [Alcanivoracaceae bacterium]|nr:methionyl-tRNA formyltransferase [Alcanivoracaceae bacterium]